MGKNTQTPAAITSAIDATILIAGKFKDLTDKLSADLAAKWKTDMGIDMPSAPDSLVRSVNIFAQYSKGLTVAPYIQDVKTLVSNSMKPDLMSKVDAIAQVVGSIVQLAIGSVSVAANITSNSVKVSPDSGDPYIVATYINTEKANSSQWGVNQDFIVAAFAFIIWTPKHSAVNNAAAVAHLLSIKDIKDTDSLLS